MKFCPKCGNKQPENGGVFCSKCGHKQAENISQSISAPKTQPPSKQHVQPSQQQHYQQASPSGQNNVAATGGKKGIIPTIIGAILLVFGIMRRSNVMDHPAVRLGHFDCGRCSTCEDLFGWLVISTIVIVVGIIFGIIGLAKLLRSSSQ